MQFGILGLPKVGKTTLYNTLTASHEATGKFESAGQTHVAVARVPDHRLAALRDLFKPRKYTPATVEYHDIPGISAGEGAESLDLAKLKTVDALMHVVRAFDDPEIAHPDGSVDARRDIATLDLELILADHSLVERRLDRVIRASYGLLGVISFFTVGEDEVRAWTIRRGTVAREAAGTIHSDIERGFIRAEVVRWDDLLKHGTLAHCRDKALLRLEGKEYVVADGDVVHFRFNV